MKTYYTFTGVYNSGKEVKLVASSQDQAFERFKDLSNRKSLGEINRDNIYCPFFK